ncbi:Helicase conserved C-terminal domain-containing protein [Lihuaxuella thermophila]|uniref:Helicase conserved C-terminal domain-containing protein n=1 Tax=Lihuaxuella thermophila TaxID=1173111 RepID=A0A1H8JLX8_9BACL|nr:Helicase conserved C-terminal domain-containing protein [Lihuaxuella thermophila]
MFGFRKNGERVSPPDLIIQDELHLISGPLGSMVGHYETLITTLCINPNTGKGPKVIASTATISRAKEQAHALYNCGIENIFQFPPQCIDAGESFFAYVENDSTKKPGRVYVGIHASGLPSHATAQVRVISALLQSVKMVSVKDEKERDAYWTIVNYFNSLRELGHAATLVSADIPEYMRAMWNRKNIAKENRRFINKLIELTSRADSSEIPKYLQELELKYLGSNDYKPVDICLATNMISVGLDISRLGIMTVIGQPKTTSEYIQATSRVGRSSEGPGLVFVIYNTSKPRDRSLYEQFYTYHSKIYSYVEPTTVTPFATPVRERALHALIVGLVRYLGNEDNLKSPSPVPSDDLQKMISEIILERVKNIDSTELDNTKNLIYKRFQEWINYSPVVYGNPMGQNMNMPLMYPSSLVGNQDLQKKAWATPTSMRNVDVECEARVIDFYPDEEDKN